MVIHDWQRRALSFSEIARHTGNAMLPRCARGVVFGEQQRRLGASYVPSDIVGEYAQEHVRKDPFRQSAMDPMHV